MKVFRRVMSPAGLIAAAGLTMAACGGSGTASPVGSTTPHSTTTVPSMASFRQFVADGRYAAGTMSFTLKGDPVSVWYPADPSAAVGKQKYAYRITQFLPKLIDSFIPKTFPDAVAEDAYAGLPVAAGAFPVVMFSHGFTGYPAQSSFLTAHLATWGFIVVSPEMTDMDVADAVEGKLPDVSKTAVAQKMLADNVSQQEAALDYVVAQGTTAGSLFDGHVNAGEVAFVGHSYGGATAVETARADSRIKVVVSLAGVPTTPLPRSIPILFMTGTYDQTIPTKDVVSFYDQFKPGKALLEIDDTGHNVFDDICTVNHAHGGIPGAITSLHLPVPKGLLVAATDGCNAPDVYPPLAWPLIDEATTAYLMYGFGIDKTLTGLGSGIDHLFAVTTSFQAG